MLKRLGLLTLQALIFCSFEASAARSEFERQYCRVLLTDTIETRSVLGTGTSRPEKVVFAGGSAAVLKESGNVVVSARDASILNERLVHLLVRQLRLDARVAPTVIRKIDDTQASLQLFIEGPQTLNDLRWSAPVLNSKFQRQISQMAVVDGWAGNRDRTPGNFLVHDDGAIEMIDHSLVRLIDAHPGPDPFPDIVFPDHPQYFQRALPSSRARIPFGFDRRIIESLEWFTDTMIAELLNSVKRNAIYRNDDIFIARRDHLIRRLRHFARMKQDPTYADFDSSQREEFQLTRDNRWEARHSFPRGVSRDGMIPAGTIVHFYQHKGRMLSVIRFRAMLIIGINSDPNRKFTPLYQPGTIVVFTRNGSGWDLHALQVDPREMVGARELGPDQRLRVVDYYDPENGPNIIHHTDGQVTFTYNQMPLFEDLLR